MTTTPTSTFLCLLLVLLVSPLLVRAKHHEFDHHSSNLRMVDYRSGPGVSSKNIAAEANEHEPDQTTKLISQITEARDLQEDDDLVPRCGWATSSGSCTYSWVCNSPFSPCVAGCTAEETCNFFGTFTFQERTMTLVDASTCLFEVRVSTTINTATEVVTYDAYVYRPETGNYCIRSSDAPPGASNEGANCQFAANGFSHDLTFSQCPLEPELTPAPISEPTPPPTSEPTPEPTPAPTSEPTPEPTPAPIEGPTPAPISEPVPAPTSEPTPASTPEPTPSPGPPPNPSPGPPGPPGPPGNGGDATCFSESTILDVLGKGPTKMQDIKIGEKVLTGGVTKRSYEIVYGWAHKEINTMAEFLVLHTSTGKEPLEVTKEHLLVMPGQKYVAAKNLRVGDELETGEDVPATITKIEIAQKRGLYAPLTPSGRLVVSGLKASCYISIGPEMIWGDANAQHFLSHFSLSPVRSLCLGATSKFCAEGSSEYPWFVRLWFAMTKFYSDQQGTVLQKVLLLVYTVVFGTFWALEQVFGAAAVCVCVLMFGQATARRLNLSGKDSIFSSSKSKQP